MAQKVQEKEKDNKAIEDYNKLVEAQDKKRQDEWAAREQRIQNLMNRMADTVVRQKDERNKVLEDQVMQYQLEKERRDFEIETVKRLRKMRKHEEIKKTLDIQMNEKELKKQEEKF